MKFFYKCINCGAEYHTDEVMYLCPRCERENKASLPPRGVLKVLYDYAGLKQKYRRLQEYNFLDLLPIKSLESLPSLRVGDTPLYHFDSIEGEKFDFDLFIKDDSQNPTYSFKDRASAVVSAYAKERGISTIVAASTGNAGSSLAGIAASQGQRAIIFVPESAPLAKLTQIVMYGARLVKVRGNYDRAFDLSIQASKENGWYNRNTAYNPLTIEGKKTVSFELFLQFKGVPDIIFVPVGDGVIISGVYKGFEDLMQVGLVNRMPIIVAVQSKGSNNFVANLYSDEFVSKPSATIADSISVDIPRNFYMARDFIVKYSGEGIEVSDKEIVEASKILSRNTGLFAEPAAAAAFAGFLRYWRDGKINNGLKVVVLSTGSGLKDLKAVQSIIESYTEVETI